MGDQSFVSQETRARVRAAITPIAVGAGRIGLTPNALTVIGFLISGVAAATAAAQLWIPAAALVIFGGSFDMLDGGLARAQNRVTRFGAFLDSTLDRWGEGVVYIGIVAGARGQLWLALALGIIFVTASITAVQRTWHVRTQLRKEEHREQ